LACINKEVQELAQSTIFSYNDVLSLYDHYRSIDMVEYVCTFLALHALSASWLMYEISRGRDPFEKVIFY
jgi:hypothetical protein